MNDVEWQRNTATIPGNRANKTQIWYTDSIADSDIIKLMNSLMSILLVFSGNNVNANKQCAKATVFTRNNDDDGNEDGDAEPMPQMRDRVRREHFGYTFRWAGI